MASVVGGCENFEAGVHLTAASIKQNCGSRDNGSAASSSQCMGMVASRGCLNFFLLKLRRNPLHKMILVVLLTFLVPSNGFGLHSGFLSKHIFHQFRVHCLDKQHSGTTPGTSTRAVAISANLAKVSFSGKTPIGPSGPTLPGAGEDLSFLEASPYWDQSNIPLNLAKQKNPFVGKIVSAQSIVGPNAPGDICNIVIDHRGIISSKEKKQIFLQKAEHKNFEAALTTRIFTQDLSRRAAVLGRSIIRHTSAWH